MPVDRSTVIPHYADTGAVVLNGTGEMQMAIKWKIGRDGEFDKFTGRSQSGTAVIRFFSDWETGHAGHRVEVNGRKLPGSYTWLDDAKRAAEERLKPPA